MAYYNEFLDEAGQSKNKWIAIIAVLFIYILFFVLFSIVGLKHMVPLPPEYGIELDMSGGGGGGSMSAVAPAPSSQTENAVTSQPAKVRSSARIATQQSEETPKLVSNNVTNNNDNKEKIASQPVVNDAALFKKRNNNRESGSGSGTGTGAGSGKGIGSGSGSGGGSGAGVGRGDGDFWLDGRPVILKEYPKAPTNTEGVVIVEFLADKTGKVVYAKAGARGTTINDASLWAECERAAKASVFKAKADAVGEQKGVIKYKFVL